ncbi:MAG TPA: hydrolase [Phycisphaerae bacterium]|nr:hydrolase [Phycisphaerae bacterium]
MIEKEDTVLVVVDVQEKLAKSVYDSDRLIDNIAILVKGADILGVPIIWTEQYPQGLGHTVQPLADLIKSPAIEKKCFSCCYAEDFIDVLEDLGRPNVLLAGIETHVCVYQTAMDLLYEDCNVFVVADAVSSRTQENKAIGLERIVSECAEVTSVEMALFELLKVAEGPQFKAILKLVK